MDWWKLEEPGLGRANDQKISRSDRLRDRPTYYLCCRRHAHWPCLIMFKKECHAPNDWCEMNRVMRAIVLILHSKQNAELEWPWWLLDSTANVSHTGIEIFWVAQRRDRNPHSTPHLRKEFVDMPLGVSEADGRPGAGVHFEGFTYQGEWPLAFSLVFPGTFDPGYMTSKRFDFFCDQWLSYINSILQVVWAVLQSFIDPR